MRTLPLAAALLLALVPCAGLPPAPLPARPGSPLVASVCDLSSSEVAAYGSALARSADGTRFAAVDEDNDAVVILAREHGALSVERRVAVGRRPAQAMLTPTALWVVERGEGTLGVYDLADGRRRCRIPVARDPVSFARTADGATLLVAATLPPRLIGIDARSGARRFEVAVPREPRGLWVSAAGDRVVLSHLAGDPLSAVDLRGGAAVAHPLPSFGYAKATELACEGDMDGCAAFVRFEAPSQAWSITEDPTTGRLLVPMMTSTHHTVGSVVGRDDPASVTFFTLGLFDPVTLTWDDDDAWRRPAEEMQRLTAPVASALAPGGALVVLAQARNLVAVLRRGAPDERVALPTPAAPDAVAVAPDGDVLVHSEVDHAVEYGPPAARVRLLFGAETLDPRVAHGRRLFLAASPPLTGTGMSCNACHPDGRDDGITWDLGDRRRRTPSLAGGPLAHDGRHATLDALLADPSSHPGAAYVPTADARADLLAWLDPL